MTSLTGIPALDLAIGLSFIYLVLSLLASTVQEWIAAVLALRAKTLKQGLESMLAADTVSMGTLPVLTRQATAGEPTQASPAETTTPAETMAPPDDNMLVDLFYAHPLIRSLYRSPTKSDTVTDLQKLGRLPSYISPHTFAVALRDVLDLPTEVTDLVKTVDGLNIPASVKARLLALARQSGNDVAAFQGQLEKWFDDAMARVSGWYKRKTQWILLVIGVIVTFALNANTLTMGQQLYKDPTVRAAVVAQASSGQVTGQTQGSNATDSLNKAANDVESVHALGVPLGWPSRASDPAHVAFHDAGDVLRNLLGWLLTIGAISLGAPFWFDTLSRVSRLRSSGKPETPLPASGSGQPNERVPAPAATP